MGEFLVAGTLEALLAMAHKHLERGVASPFLVSSHLELLRLGTDARRSSHSIPPAHTPHHISNLIVHN
jgi:hypothetical protein